MPEVECFSLHLPTQPQQNLFGRREASARVLSGKLFPCIGCQTQNSLLMHPHIIGFSGGRGRDYTLDVIGVFDLPIPDVVQAAYLYSERQSE